MTTDKSSAHRVRLHRQQLQQAGSVRLEVSVGSDVAADIKALAALQQVPAWAVVQEARYR